MLDVKDKLGVIDKPDVIDKLGVIYICASSNATSF